MLSKGHHDHNTYLSKVVTVLCQIQASLFQAQAKTHVVFLQEPPLN